MRNIDVESLPVLQKELDNHLNMHLGNIKNLPHEHVEVEHLLWILCINLLLLAAQWTVLLTAYSQWRDLIPRLAKMPNTCAFPWFIIPHSSCSQITSCRSSFRNKRAANAKAPGLRKVLRVCDICSASIATPMYTISSKEVWKLNFRQYGQMEKHHSHGEDQRWRKSDERRCRCAKR